MRPQPDQDARTGRRIALADICASVVLATLNVAVGLLARSTSVVA
jgi:divalent metal cation (Fe/Co/Zn/Cd) transporter